jgi:hypothetical protein
MVDLFKLAVAISVGLLDEAAERADKEIEIPAVKKKIRLEDAGRFILFGGSLAVDYMGLARFGIARDIVETVEVASAPLAVKSAVKIVTPVARTYLGPVYTVEEVTPAPAPTAPPEVAPGAPRITSY